MSQRHNQSKTARAPTGRLERFAKLSSTATGVAARMAGERLAELLAPRDRRAAMRTRSLQKSGKQIVRVMGELKGVAMKVGQMLSVDPEMIPPELQEALTVLQRSAPPMDYEQVVAQIESALDQPIHQVFKFFDPEPVGAASIGQVHRAETFDGQVVAVKVQYPGIADTIDSDIKNLGSLLGMVGSVMDRQRFDAYMDEARAVLVEESDYLAEARNLEQYGRLLQGYDGIRAPRPDLERCAKTVLTMDYIAGVKLDDHLESLPVGEARNVLGERFVHLMSTMFHDHHVLHADPHPGNFLVDEQGHIVLLDFGCVRRFDPVFTRGILQLLVYLWEGDAEGMCALYKDLGWGLGTRDFDPELIYELSELVLAPFVDDAPFSFGDWQVQEPLTRMLLKHMDLKLFAPPREALLYMRVVAGLRGLLKRMDITFSPGRMAREIAARHGLWDD